MLKIYNNNKQSYMTKLIIGKLLKFGAGCYQSVIKLSKTIKNLKRTEQVKDENIILINSGSIFATNLP